MKDFGVKPYLFPMPVYMIGTYNEDDTVDAMAMAWGGICAENMVALNLEEDHKTVANLKARGAFTLSVPGRDTIVESDYMGLVSSNKVPDKFERTGLHAVKSSRVDAPVILEYPLTLECRVLYAQEQVESAIPDELRARFYSGPNAGDAHTAYIGLIERAYVIRGEG